MKFTFLFGFIRLLIGIGISWDFIAFVILDVVGIWFQA